MNKTPASRRRPALAFNRLAISRQPDERELRELGEGYFFSDDPWVDPRPAHQCHCAATPRQPSRWRKFRFARWGNEHNDDTELGWRLIRHSGDCCNDCRGDFEGFMVFDFVWSQACAAVPGMEDERGYLCILCLERRLGRQLNCTDFNDAPMNFEPYRRRSPLLRSRLAAAPPSSRHRNVRYDEEGNRHEFPPKRGNSRHRRQI